MWTAERVKLALRLWKDGLSAGQIAREVGGVTRNAVIGLVHRRKAPPRPRAAAAPRPPAEQKPRRSTRLALVGAAKPQLGPQPSPAAVAAERSRAAARIDQQAPDTRPCRLLELRDDSCRWPLGDPREPSFRFCGAPRPEGASYCHCHARLAFEPVGARR